MALNIELGAPRHLPVAYLDERFIGAQAGLDCSLHVLERPLRWHDRFSQPWRDQSRFGFIPEATAVLTNIRLVLIARPDAPGTASWGTPTPIHSLEVPLHGVSEERFEQPLVSACRLEAVVAAFAGQQALPLKFRIRIEFAYGGFGGFIPLFTAALTRVRRVQSNLELARHRLASAHDDELGSIMVSADDLDWTTRQVAVLDPSDPSQLLVLQPVPNPGPAPRSRAWSSAASISAYLHSANDSMDVQSQA
jgi:hypothetical protein